MAHEPEDGEPDVPRDPPDAPPDGPGSGTGSPGSAPSESSSPSSFFARHRSRILRVALLAFAVVVLLDLSQSLPRATTIDLALGEHAGASAIALDVLGQGGEAVLSTRLRFPDGAPGHLTEELDLPPGSWRVRIEAEGPGDVSATLEGRFETPAEGTVHVLLRPADR